MGTGNADGEGVYFLDLIFPHIRLILPTAITESGQSDSFMCLSQIQHSSANCNKDGQFRAIIFGN